MIYKCPCCGADVSAVIEDAFREQRSAAGKTKTKKKSEASAQNMRKAAAIANASYTPEKRAAAAQKRLATIARKKASQ